MKIGIFRGGRVGTGRIDKFTGSDGTIYYPGDVVLIPDETVKAGDKLKNTLEILDLENIMQTFKMGMDVRNVLMIRSGGFGDLLALSSMTELLKDYNIHFYTQKERFGEAINWHTNQNVNVFEHTKPMFRDFRQHQIFTKLRSWAYVDINGIVETDACSRNWYNVFFEQIGVDFKPELGRPSLVSLNLDDSQNRLKSGKKSMLLCPKASAMMRTMNFTDMVLATNDLNYQRYVHKFDLMAGDDLICEANNINIIGDCSAHDVFVNLWFADMVLCVDSMPIHFREGIGKPCLAVYSAFESKSRTKWYTHTCSIDIKSDCPLQFCYLHEWMNGQHVPFCPKGKDMKYAPCLSGVSFINQLKKELYAYLQKL